MKSNQYTEGKKKLLLLSSTKVLGKAGHHLGLTRFVNIATQTYELDPDRVASSIFLHEVLTETFFWVAVAAMRSNQADRGWARFTTLLLVFWGVQLQGSRSA